jgi:hypothetical protein
MSVYSKQRQIKEIVRCGKEPIYFFNKYAKIDHPVKGLVPFKTYPFQDDCVKDFQEHRYNIILKSRQLGLSTLSAAYAVWLAVFYKNKNVLVIATKLAVAMNFIKKVKTVLRNMPKWLLLPEIVENNKQSVTFSNGSVIKAIPTSNDAGRSEALSLLIVDEAAFVRNFDEVYTGLYSTLSTGGSAIILSTPNGVGNQYHKLYSEAEAGLNEYNPIVLPWHVHPERDQEWFDNESKNLSPKQVAQELLCDFAASGDTFLQAEDIEYVRGAVVPPLEKWGPKAGVWVWKYAMGDTKYVISADVAAGSTESDYSAFHVIDTHKSEVVAEYKGVLPPDKFAQVLAEAGRKYNQALLCPENNTYGYAVIMKLLELGYENLYYLDNRHRYAIEKDITKIGFNTNSKTRPQILTKLEEMLRNKQVKIYSSRLYDELKTFIWKNNKAQAQRGKNDDLVMSLAIGLWLYDCDPTLTVQAAKMNTAMLEAMSVNRRDVPKPQKNPYSHLSHDPYRPVYVDGDFSKAERELNQKFDFSWLVK